MDYLRAVIDALSGVVDEVGSGSDGDVTAMTLVARRRRRWALDRVTQLIVTPPHRLPVVLDPVDRVALLSRQGQPLTPVITAGSAGTTGLSSAQVWMPPGHAAHAHLHHHTDIGVVVLQGRAITLWWDTGGVMHEVVQSAGQHLHIPYGVVHAAINPFNQPVVAVEWRANRIFNADNERTPALDSAVRARLAQAKVAA